MPVTQVVRYLQFHNLQGFLQLQDKMDTNIAIKSTCNCGNFTIAIDFISVIYVFARETGVID